MDPIESLNRLANPEIDRQSLNQSARDWAHASAEITRIFNDERLRDYADTYIERRKPVRTVTAAEITDSITQCIELLKKLGEKPK